MLRFRHRRNGAQDCGPDLSSHPPLPEAARIADGPGTMARQGPTRSATPVLLSPGTAELEAALAEVLGRDFAVRTEGPFADGVMIVGSVGPVGIAFLRAAYLSAILLVVDRRGRYPQAAQAVANLEAGADGYLSSPSTVEVASHVTALARRAQPIGAGAPSWVRAGCRRTFGVTRSGRVTPVRPLQRSVRAGLRSRR